MEITQVSTLFNPELILFDVTANDRTELLKKLSQKLKEKGYVRESFEEAVIEREKVYPTGLPTPGVSVALPHTDSIHVLKPVILIANLKRPVAFKEMGNGIRDILAELVFMLAINQPEKQIEVLKKLMSIFSKKDVLLAIKEAKNPSKVLEILKEQMN
ncbi:PTS sugar transporter subunit IIA [Thermohalobacter berrensis]|uniref:PTS ascorbate transporter subunit IIA n=1 Tax=Thermohalobacter berrensis TaxID=99594 RepID=A0A419SZD8_9FIRM|nr:PTS sugar transporter subunit IIA [Thermohalobacter berrensis]RKD30518.1 PTS ascorbate transporter subunit IIA [Thermohalobacter berrensis]